jgi:hypothetical protein
MGNELSDRQAAIRMRLAGESITNICRTLKRSKPWFHKWWKRYLALGPEGLYDLTRANQRVVNRTPPHIERAVVSIRRRLAARATPQTRYSRVGAPPPAGHNPCYRCKAGRRNTDARRRHPSGGSLCPSRRGQLPFNTLSVTLRQAGIFRPFIRLAVR